MKLEVKYYLNSMCFVDISILIVACCYDKLSSSDSHAPYDLSFLDSSKFSPFIKLHKMVTLKMKTHEVYRLKHLLEHFHLINNIWPITQTGAGFISRLIQTATVPQKPDGLLIMKLVLPVSSSSCEISFSVTKLMKSDLRNDRRR